MMRLLAWSLLNKKYHEHVHLVFIVCKLNATWRLNLHQLTSLAESQKALEAHDSKPWVTNLSIVPHTLGILTANTTYCIIIFEYVKESHSSEHPHGVYS